MFESFKEIGKILLSLFVVYVRLLDVNPENHAIIYVCGNILDDGSCDPDRTYIDVLTRTRDDLDEQVRAHLRDVLRKAGFAPGDFVKAYNAGCKSQLNLYHIAQKKSYYPARLGEWYLLE